MGTQDYSRRNHGDHNNGGGQSNAGDRGAEDSCSSARLGGLLGETFGCEIVDPRLSLGLLPARSLFKLLLAHRDDDGVAVSSRPHCHLIPRDGY